MQDGKKVIFCIDDDPDVLSFLKTVLESAGYGVVSAPSAEEGKRKFKDINPDFVIVDLMMEEVDSGTAFVRELKALGCTVPIYMLSSAGDALNLTTSYSEIGLDGVLQKPVDADNLLAVIKAKLA